MSAFFFKYFLNNLPLKFFLLLKSGFQILQSNAIKIHKLLLKNADSLVRNELSKLKFDQVGQVFNTQKPSLNKISSTGKLQHEISLSILSDHVALC